MAYFIMILFAFAQPRVIGATHFICRLLAITLFMLRRADFMDNGFGGFPWKFVDIFNRTFFFEAERNGLLQMFRF